MIKLFAFLFVIYILTSSYTASTTQARIGSYETSNFKISGGASLNTFNDMKANSMSDENLLKSDNSTATDAMRSVVDHLDALDARSMAVQPTSRRRCNSELMLRSEAKQQIDDIGDVTAPVTSMKICA